ncbi:hypothetical protein J8273_8468 [Carpediemonas membranifera]|uniref:Uncharacterized protein n=1 Tax=Carpediemonas membranifera TaxID=201153 RepID=A0A8J6ART1_9EUKA|nr:hypothetical protein J8273_8468 [Carpediemonas membranifera]|eukprot:KAG9389790.1 hypothetical protein J8273_8468 [Carpediemonas membranifera]
MKTCETRTKDHPQPQPPKLTNHHLDVHIKTLQGDLCLLQAGIRWLVQQLEEVETTETERNCLGRYALAHDDLVRIHQAFGLECLGGAERTRIGPIFMEESRQVIITQGGLNADELRAMQLAEDERGTWHEVEAPNEAPEGVELVDRGEQWTMLHRLHAVVTRSRKRTDDGKLNSSTAEANRLLARLSAPRPSATAILAFLDHFDNDAEIISDSLVSPAAKARKLRTLLLDQLLCLMADPDEDDYPTLIGDAFNAAEELKNHEDLHAAIYGQKPAIQVSGLPQRPPRRPGRGLVPAPHEPPQQPTPAPPHTKSQMTPPQPQNYAQPQVQLKPLSQEEREKCRSNDLRHTLYALMASTRTMCPIS